jgi:hypothetical protein
MLPCITSQIVRSVVLFITVIITYIASFYMNVSALQCAFVFVYTGGTMAHIYCVQSAQFNTVKATFISISTFLVPITYHSLFIYDVGVSFYDISLYPETPLTNATDDKPNYDSKHGGVTVTTVPMFFFVILLEIASAVFVAVSNPLVEADDFRDDLPGVSIIYQTVMTFHAATKTVADLVAYSANETPLSAEENAVCKIFVVTMLFLALAFVIYQAKMLVKLSRSASVSIERRVSEDSV